MFGTLAQLMYRRRWYVVSAWVLVLVVAFALASQVGSILGPGEYSIKGADSQIAAQILSSRFHKDPNKTSLVVIQSPRLTYTSPAYVAAVSDIVGRIRTDKALHVAYLDNPLVSHNAQLLSRDRHGVAILFSSNMKEPDIEKQIVPLRHLVQQPGYGVQVTGGPAENHDYAKGSESDLSHGEMFTVPILLIILLLVFGSLVAAGLPLLLAGFAIVMSLAGVYGFGHVLNASVYVQNVVTILGLGLAIDYSLFIVYRFREELERLGDVEAAVVRTMQTTGRAIFFSGLAVAIGLSSLILTQITFMQSMGLGGVLVPISSMLVALTLLPAVLGLLGHRINSLRVIPTRFLQLGERGMWHRIATTIMRRPLLFGGSVLVLMLAASFPVTKITLAYGGLKNADKTQESIQAYIYMQSHFPSTPDPAQVVVQGPGTSVLAPGQLAGIGLLENRLRQVSGVVRVVGPADFAPASGHPSRNQLQRLVGEYVTSDLKTGLIEVVPKFIAGTNAGDNMVTSLRHQIAAAKAQMPGDKVYVGGAAAAYLDFDNALYSKFPYIVLLILALTYGFLFFAFRSVFLPLKAVILNLLSVGAAYGILQLVFQRGIGSGILSFSPEDGIAPWVPVFLFAFLFGLSMDYEVFLISRIREYWLQTGNNRAAVPFGLEKTGRLISSAAAIMVVAFSGFLLGHQIQFKEFALGMMAAVALDATLIRVILVPSIMELMNDWNWWLPGFLQRFAEKGSDELEVARSEPEPVPVGR